MNRYDVYVAHLDPTRGSEIAKARPVVIVSPDNLNKVLRTVLIAPMTSASRHWPSRVASMFAGRSGQIALDQIRCVDKSRLARKLGKLDTATASATCAVLVEMFAE
jgi:mRNA interferase MazF